MDGHVFGYGDTDSGLFILLFSMSQIDMVKFDALSESFRNRMIFDFHPSPVPMENPTEHTSDEESGKTPMNSKTGAA